MKNMLPAVALLLSSSFASAAAVGGKDFAPEAPAARAGAAVGPRAAAGAVSPVKKPQTKRVAKKTSRPARA